jgi:rod shape-determining protein MreC
MSPLKRYRDRAVVVLLLAVPFFFLRANMKKPENLNALDRLALRASAPVEYVVSAMARGTSNVFQHYFWLVDVKADNERLEYENARLHEEIHHQQQTEVDNRDLRRLVQLKQSTATETVSAEVIGKDYTPFFRVTRVTLDKSSRDVAQHMPVISADGVVGAVQHASGDNVDVQLAVDAAFGVDVEDERTHARGFAKGSGDPSRYACRIEMVDSRDEVDIGDLLVTSGKGKLFPRGIPVARVTKVEKRELGRDQEVEAAPTVNFSRLEHVLILVMPIEDDGSKSTATKPKGK